ncbi:MAG: type II secretion system GspH family protein [Gammaproteobacteria bacterium]|nr:type II secretion system GspH family protein [Gammaproteobacteria bacterium]
MSRTTRCDGFTLVELIAILIVVGAVSVMALGRVSNSSTFAGLAFAQEVRAALRFAQKFAVTSGCDVQAVVDGTGESYALQLRADATGAANSCLSASGAFAGNPLRNPQSGAAFSGTAPNGVDVSGSLSVTFDAAGGVAAGGTVNIDGESVSVFAPSGLVQ